MSSDNIPQSLPPSMDHLVGIETGMLAAQLGLPEDTIRTLVQATPDQLAALVGLAGQVQEGEPWHLAARELVDPPEDQGTGTPQMESTEEPASDHNEKSAIETELSPEQAAALDSMLDSPEIGLGYVFFRSGYFPEVVKSAGDTNMDKRINYMLQLTPGRLAAEVDSRVYDNRRSSPDGGDHTFALYGEYDGDTYLHMMLSSSEGARDSGRADLAFSLVVPSKAEFSQVLSAIKAEPNLLRVLLGRAAGRFVPTEVLSYLEHSKPIQGYMTDQRVIDLFDEFFKWQPVPTNPPPSEADPQTRAGRRVWRRG